MPAVCKPKSRPSPDYVARVAVRGHRRRTLLLAVASLCFGPCMPPVSRAADVVAERAPGRDQDLRVLVLTVTINGEAREPATLMLEDANGQLYAAQPDLQEMRLRLPDAAPLLFKGRYYYRLSALPGTFVRLDRAAMSLEVTSTPESFRPTDVALPRTAYPAPTTPSPGAFLNYDLLAARLPDGAMAAGLFEVGAFSPLGSGLSTLALQKSKGLPSALRLDTTFVVDRPLERASFRVGDAASRPAVIGGRSVRFGGLQYATNFATQPGLVTFPAPSIHGLAMLPSTVDVYVDNMLLSQRQVRPGPFSISEFPVVGGQGEVSLVVRDMLGREEVVTRPFYASVGMLRPGLDDVSFETGALRENYGVRSNDYGPLFASGTYRIGVHERLTAQGQVQWQEALGTTLAAGATVLLAPLGTFSGSGAASQGAGTNAHGPGTAWSLGWERQTRFLSFGAHTEHADVGFVQPGYSPALTQRRRQTSINAGVAAGRFGSAGAAWVMQDVHGMGRLELASINYTLGLQKAGALSVSALRTLRGPQSCALSVFWSLPLSGGVNVGASYASSPSAGDRVELQAQRNPGLVDGYGYRLQAGNRSQQAALLAQNRVGAYSFEAAAAEGHSSLRAGMAGGVAALGGAMFATRRIADSFGLVQLPGMKDVRIYVDNQLAARTDAEGNALLPNLRAYDNNPVRVEQMDLALDAEVGALTANPVPYAHSGVIVRVPIRRSRSALLRLITEDGAPLPAGAEVEMNGRRFPVALDGAVYLTDLGEANRLQALAGDRRCNAEIIVALQTRPAPDLGTFVCHPDRVGPAELGDERRR